MRSSLLFLVFGFTFVSLGYALPAANAEAHTFLSKRVVSPDNTCGNVYAGSNQGYICNATVNAGGCCSHYGYCGNSTDYCSPGCQSDFGTCNRVAPPPGGDNFTCGPANHNLQCNTGLCCSQAGYCGSTTDYCGRGCQPGFGICNPTTLVPTTCGPNFENTTCGNNQCCSVSGYCGNTQDYCADPSNCMLGYGRCDSDATPAGPSTQFVPRRLKGPVTYTDNIIGCVEKNVVALSYDDGPSQYTSELLDLLKSYGFHATFFITGNNNGKGEIDITPPYPDLIRRMISEGHQVASHTWSHYSLSNISHDLRIAQMVKNEIVLNNILGMWPTYMRPPYSQCSKDSGCEADMKALGYHRVYFDLDTNDYLNISPSEIQKSKNTVQQKLGVRRATGYLSIQHDILQQSVTNLSSYYYDLIQKKGWKGVTVGECLGDTDRSNWYRSFNDSSSSSSTPPAQSVIAGPSGRRKARDIASSIVGPTSSKTKSSDPSPTSTQTCIMQNGSWCGNIPAFTTYPGCQQASTNCSGQTVKCYGGGSTNLGICPKWTQMCFDLNAFCSKCGTGGQCDLVTFLAGLNLGN